MEKKFFVFIAALLFACAIPAFSADQQPVSDEELDYAQMASLIDEVGKPYLKGDYVIFTAQKTARYVGIAFDFEDYAIIHQFKIRSIRDIEYNVKESLYFYILKLPKDLETIHYRLVIDGLWTLDPNNSRKAYDPKSGLTMSELDVKREIPPATEETKKGIVRFVYRGKSGQKVRLGGSFTNWDSWIYEMVEVEPGLYEFELPLPPGEYQYAFYTGITSFSDSTNPSKCYTADGREASLLIVKN